MSIVTLLNSSQAQAAVSDITQVTIGSRAEVEIEGWPERPSGRVDRINPSAEPGSRTITFTSRFPMKIHCSRPACSRACTCATA